MSRIWTLALVTALMLAGCAQKMPSWHAADVIDAFQAAGLQAESARAMTPDDYGPAPMLATEGVRFLVPSLCPDCGGRVMVFAKSEDLQATQRYYDALGKESALFFSWTYTRGNVLVQINGELPEVKASKYNAALQNMTVGS